MSSFQNQLIDKILHSSTEAALYETVVVLPNRRACRLLQQGLSGSGGGRPMFAPQILPMEEFVGWLSPLKVIDAVTQLLRLHTLTRHYPGSRFETHQLLSWGVTFLNDISDMDMQLQDVPDCMRCYAEAAKFEIPFGKDEVSDMEREKIMFNELLADIYLDYRKSLREHGEAYEGMLYRDCAENMAGYMPKITCKRLIFAGFYALSPSELEIIRQLKTRFPTEVYFDIDPFYCQIGDPPGDRFARSETSYFIRRNCEILGLDAARLDFCEPHYASVPKTVSIVSTARNMRQIYCAIEEVERIKRRKMAEAGIGADDKTTTVDMSDTAVVLADEKLALPFMLSYQPENLTINATMGFPFEDTPVYNILMTVMAVYESALALTNDGAPELSFSGEDVSRLWDHEPLRREKPQDFYFPTVIRYSQLPHSEIFENLPRTMLARRLPALTYRFCQYAKSLASEPVYRLLWREAARCLAGLESLFDTYFGEQEPVDFQFAKFSVMKSLQPVAISMQGDPDRGLQVMGLLETRLMDFKNVVMLSVNEGTLPKGVTYNSLLPFDFKYKFGRQDALMNYLYQDQVYAYHFFRLLQRAENVTLVYNSASDVNLAERSRFIAQLEYEVVAQGLSETVRVVRKSLDFPLELPVRQPMQMPKTEAVTALLRKFKFSASSLQTYIACPLKFYFKYLMRICEPPVLSDHLEAYELGTVIHALYKQAFDDLIAEQDPANYAAILQRHIDSSEADICREIRQLDGRKTLTESDLEQGYWLINRRIVRETVNNYLEVAKKELAKSSWKIMANEMHVDIADYPVVPVSGGVPFHVRLTGSLDRVQHDGRAVMILDYKTGHVEASSLNLTIAKSAQGNEVARAEVLDKPFTDSKYDKLFQLILYALMYEHVAKEKPTSVQVGVISTREVNRNRAAYLLPGAIFGDADILRHKEALSERLNSLFCSLFDTSEPFTQTDKKEICQYCDFLRICGRQTRTESRV